MTYNPAIPQPTDNLSDSQGDILNNFASANTNFGINHTAFDVALEPGKHKYIQIPVDTNPGGMTGASEILLYNGALAGKYDLFFVSAGKNVPADTIQLTRNDIPSATANGYSWMAGGILIQWGIVAGTTNGNVIFNTAPNIAFANCFGVWGQVNYVGAAPNGAAELAFKLNGNTSFDWNFFTNSGAYSGFFWWAIGN